MAIEKNILLKINATAKGVANVTRDLGAMAKDGLKPIADAAKKAAEAQREAVKAFEKAQKDHAAALKDETKAAIDNGKAQEAAANAAKKSAEAKTSAVIAAERAETAGVIAETARRKAARTGATKEEQAEAKRTAAVAMEQSKRADKLKGEVLAAGERERTALAKAEAANRIAIDAAARREQTIQAVNSAREQAAAATSVARQEAVALSGRRSLYNSLASTVRTVTVAATAAAASALAAGTALVTSFARYETSLIAVGKVANLSGADLEQFGKLAQGAAKKLSAPTNEILGISQAAAQLGVRGVKSLISFSETIKKLSSNTEVASDELAVAFTRILDLTGESVETVGRAANVFTELTNAGVSAQELVPVATRVAQSIAAFKPSTAQVLGLSAALRMSGVQAERAGGVMERAFNGIQKAISDGGVDFLQLQRITGQTGDEIKKQFAENAPEFFRVFIHALEGVSRDKLPGVLAQFDLAGSEGISAISALASNVDVLDAAMKRAEDSAVSTTSATDREFSASARTIQRIYDGVTSRIEQLAVSVGEKLAPNVRALLDQTIKFIDALKPEDITKIAAAFNEVATAIGAVITKIPVAIKFIREGFAGIKLFDLDLQLGDSLDKIIDVTGELRETQKNLDAARADLDEALSKEPNYRGYLKRRVEAFEAEKALLEGELQLAKERRDVVTRQRTDILATAPTSSVVQGGLNTAEDFMRDKLGLSPKKRPAASGEQYGPAMQNAPGEQFGPFQQQGPGTKPGAEIFDDIPNAPALDPAGVASDALPPGAQGNPALAPLTQGGELPTVGAYDVAGATNDLKAGPTLGSSSAGGLMAAILPSAGTTTGGGAPIVPGETTEPPKTIDDLLPAADGTVANPKLGPIDKKLYEEAQERQNEQLAESKALIDAYEAEELADRDAFNAQMNAADERGLTGRLTAFIDWQTQYKQYDKRHNDDLLKSRQNFEGALSDIIKFAGSKNAGIAKAFAVAQATWNAYQAATLAMATIPPPAGQIVAGVILAAGLANVATIVSTDAPGMLEGGVTVGGTKGKDSIPTMLAPKEIVAPAKNFDEVIDAMARSRGYTPPGGAAQGMQQQGPIKIELELRDDLGQFVQERINAARDLGTIR